MAQIVEHDIHWTSTPEGWCKRKDDGSDREERVPGGAIRAIGTGEAMYIQNVTCRTCLLHYRRQLGRVTKS